MKLIDPGVGELSDRLSILALKILFGEAAGRPVDHFRTEQSVILTKIRSRTLNGVWFAAYTELAAVNAALWHAEDDLREWREQYVGREPAAPMAQIVVELAFRIQSLNDRRAELVGKINTDAGEKAGAEKLTVRETPSEAQP